MKDIGTLILRLGMGGLMIPHGIQKLMDFSEKKEKFVSFMTMSPAMSLGLSIFAELVCGALVVLGLFTRVASAFLVINMGTAVIVAHNWDVTNTAEKATLFLTGYLCLLCTGGGRYSLDRAFFKWGK